MKVLLSRMVLLLLWTVGQVMAADKPSKQLGTDDFPHFDNGDMVEFYYIEGVFPFTTPESIVDGSGDLFTSYSLTHAGLGVWNKERHIKMSIELVCNDYIGSLLPTVIQRPNGSALLWNNSASIVLTKPINDTYWSESRLLAVSDGAAFNNLKSWIRDHESKFSVYQPVRVNPYGQGGAHVGQDLVWYVDSYKFVEGMLQSLADYGVKLQTFLDVKTTGFSYLADSSLNEGAAGSVRTLSWAQGDSPPENVTSWYATLSACYAQVWDENVGNAATFLEEVAVCYEMGYAFVYASPYSVQEVLLATSVDEDFDTPLLWRDEYELPEEDDSIHSRWDLADSLLVIAVVLGLLVGAGYFVYTRILYPPPRRKASIHWEEQATQIVSSMVKRGGAQGVTYRGRAAHPESGSAVLFSSYIDPMAVSGNSIGGATESRDNYDDEEDSDGGTNEDGVLYRYFNRPTSYQDTRPVKSRPEQGIRSALSRFVNSIIRPSFESESTVNLHNRSRNSTSDTFCTEQGAAGRGGVVSAPGGTVWGRPSTPSATSTVSNTAAPLAGGTDTPPAVPNKYSPPSPTSSPRAPIDGSEGSGDRVSGEQREERALSGFSDDLAEFLSMPSTKINSPPAPNAADQLPRPTSP